MVLLLLEPGLLDLDCAWLIVVVGLPVVLAEPSVALVLLVRLMLIYWHRLQVVVAAVAVSVQILLRWFSDPVALVEGL